MPLEVKATLDRGVPVYLTGETVTVNVTVRNVSSRGRECLAWGSVQLSCERTRGACAVPSDRTPTTAIAKSNTNVYSSRPSIIFCDVDLLPSEHRSFSCKIELPTHGLPPSFRGHLVRYLNRITIAVQHLRAPIQMTHIPIRIIPAVGLESRPTPPSNPFLAETTPQPSVSEIVTAVVDQITAPRKCYVFGMTNAQGKVSVLTLYKKAFRLGEDVVGQLSFEDATIHCVQWSVHLETEEKLAEEESEEGEKKRPSTVSVVSHCNEHTVCLNMVDGYFRLPIPMSCSPTFHTDSVHLKWRLRFEFVTARQIKGISPSGTDPGGIGLWRAPSDVPIETLTWQVDIFVLPCSPHNAALTEQSHPSAALIII